MGDLIIQQYESKFEKEVQSIYLENCQHIGQLSKKQYLGQLIKYNWKYLIIFYLLLNYTLIFHTSMRSLSLLITVNTILISMFYFLIPIILSTLLKQYQFKWGKLCIKEKDLSNIPLYYSQKNALFLAIDKNSNRVAGMVGLSEKVEEINYPFQNKQDYSKIQKLLVLKEYQGKGVAQSLMTALENLAKKQKKQKLCLQVLSSNYNAIRFYEKQGYKLISAIPEYSWNSLLNLIHLNWLIYEKEI